MKELSTRIVLRAVDRPTEEVAELLTGDISIDAMDGPPTREGIIKVFACLLGRQPGQDWFDFWIGKPNAKLKEVRRDLAIGPEFKERCGRLKKATLSALSDVN
jgi:hypothetical protein